MNKKLTERKYEPNKRGVKRNQLWKIGCLKGTEYWNIECKKSL